MQKSACTHSKRSSSVIFENNQKVAYCRDCKGKNFGFADQSTYAFSGAPGAK